MRIRGPGCKTFGTGMEKIIKFFDADPGYIRIRIRDVYPGSATLVDKAWACCAGFVRAAEGQGVSLAVILHESRALTEDKERLATPLDSAQK